MSRWKLLYAARFVAKWEGFLPYAYLDTIASPPVYTIGYGWTGLIRKGGKLRPIRSGDRISKAYALRLLTKGLRDASRAVARNIRVPLTIRQRIALISLVYNCGPGAVDGSTLARELNRRHYTKAADCFLDWSHAGGVVVQGLLNRRREERAMFLSHPDRWRAWQKH